MADVGTVLSQLITMSHRRYHRYQVRAVLKTVSHILMLCRQQWFLSAAVKCVAYRYFGQHYYVKFSVASGI